MQCFLTSASGLLPELKVKRSKKGDVVIDDGDYGDENEEEGEKKKTVEGDEDDRRKPIEKKDR